MSDDISSSARRRFGGYSPGEYIPFDEDNPNSGEQIASHRIEFTKRYLGDLKEVLSGFGAYFSVVAALFGIQSLISFASVIFAMSQSGLLGSFAFVIFTLNIGMVVWLAILCRALVNVQVRKINEEMTSNANFVKESLTMSSQILERARKKAEQIVNQIVVKGSNYGAISAISGKDNTVTQKVSVAQQKEVAESLALLLAYCQETRNQEAILLSERISSEAAKSTPDKGVIFENWTKIVTLIPVIGTVVQIANGVRTLLGM